MQFWLKWRLGALLIAVASLSGGYVWRAQSQAFLPAPKTPKETATLFFQRLEDMKLKDANFAANAFDILLFASRQDRQDLGSHCIPLFTALAQQWKPTQTKVWLVKPTSGTRVEVTSSIETGGFPLLCVCEDGGWRVDVVGTYARWNNLKGEQLTERLYHLTGIAPASRPVSLQLRREQCRNQMHIIATALFQYSQDYDELFPTAKHWQNKILPYVPIEVFNYHGDDETMKRVAPLLFRCPSLAKGSQQGYAFNSTMAGRFVEPSDRVKAVALYETSVLQKDVVGSGGNRAFRHLDGANYAFLDGHVQWLKRTQVPSFKVEIPAPDELNVQ